MVADSDQERERPIHVHAMLVRGANLERTPRFDRRRRKNSISRHQTNDGRDDQNTYKIFGRFCAGSRYS